MFSKHFVYIYLLFLNIYFNDSVRFQEPKSPDTIHIEQGHFLNIILVFKINTGFKLMKGKTLRKHSLHEKTAASVLLKLFISGNERCHTTDAP